MLVNPMMNVDTGKVTVSSDEPDKAAFTSLKNFQAAKKPVSTGFQTKRETRFELATLALAMQGKPSVC